jgi:alpha-L-fucosidase 2
LKVRWTDKALLPALPSAFPSVKVTGLRARGGIGVDIEWQDGKLVKATLTATAAKPVKLRYAGKEKDVQMNAGQAYTFGPGL